MQYRCLKESIFRIGEYSLVPIRHEDSTPIREWRNAQMDVLRQKSPISESQQEEYFKQYVWPTFDQRHPNQILFSFLENERCIGYGGLVHLSWENQRGEVSFLVETTRANDEQAYQTDMLNFFEMIKQVGKAALLHRLYVETFAFRTSHIGTLEAVGFHLEGRMRDHIFERGEFQDSVIHGLILQASE